jgi:hypothetical protein
MIIACICGGTAEILALGLLGASGFVFSWIVSFVSRKKI